MNYVVGFAFAEYPRTPGVFYVALIRKTKPDWQKGKLNGIGGKIGCEMNFDVKTFEETEHVAMVREFKAETGTETNAESWIYFADMKIPGGKVAMFTGQMEWDKFLALKTTSEEVVNLLRVDRVGEYEPLPNLAWIVPMAKFFLHNSTMPALTIEEQDVPACGLSCEP